VPVYDLTDWSNNNVYYTFMFTFLGAGAIHCFTAWITQTARGRGEKGLGPWEDQDTLSAAKLL
jgi:hypothetical protein